MLNDAKTTLEEKQKVYDAAAKAYEDYQTEYANQEKAIEDAKNAYQAAKDIYDKAAGKYADWSDKHDQKVEDLTIYHNTLADAETKYNEAVKKLSEIKDQSDKIAAAAAAAKASILANGGNSILAAIDVTEKSTSRDWDEQDKLFEEIVKNYYVPEVLEGKDANLDWKRISEDMCNYCVVTYTDKEGNEQTLVLDYVMTNKDGSLKETTDENPGKLNGNSTSKIVIFEKSEDEKKAADALDKDKNALLYDKDINVDKYKVKNEKGQTVYLDKSYVKGELAKEDGSIINVGGVYYQKGTAITDAKLTYDENGLVRDTTVGDTRTVITVDEDTVKAEDLKLEDGKFVQEYKGDTTTIVYHKELSQSGYVYDSEAEANAELATAKNDVGKEDELISDEVVSESHTEYTTSGTYIPIFQETITISKDVKSLDANFAIAEKGISVYNGLKDTKTSIEKDDYFILDENWSDISANTKEKDKFGKKENYTVSQTATFTYVSKELVKKGTEKDFVLADLFNFKSSEEAQKAVANELKSQGKILISWDSFDWRMGKATYQYIDTVQASGETCASEADANASFDSIVNAKDREGATLLESYTDLRGNKIDLVNSSTDSKVVTKYGYNLSYWNQTSKTTEKNTLIKTETSDASKVYGVVVQNQDGATVLNQVTDEKFNAFIENIKAQNARFEKLEADAKKAQEEVKTAQDKVKALEEAINKIKGTKIKGNGKDQGVKQVNGLKVLALLEDVKLSEYTLDELKAFLETAQGQLDDAKARLAKLNEQLADAEEARDNRITELTPAPAPAPTTGGGETTPAGGGTTTAPISTLATALAGTPVFALPTGGVAAPTAGVAGARTSRGVAIDSDSAAAGTEDTTAKIAPTKEVEEDALAITKDTIKTIKDNETPLSSLTEDSTQKMNWWWLLLIALLGATGEEIYRRNKKKKEEEAALKAEVDKNN